MDDLEALVDAHLAALQTVDVEKLVCGWVRRAMAGERVSVLEKDCQALRSHGPEITSALRQNRELFFTLTTNADGRSLVLRLNLYAPRKAWR